MPSPDLREVFATLEAIQTESGAAQDSLQTGIGNAIRVAATVFLGRSGPRAHGLSTSETVRWAQDIRGTLGDAQRAQLLEYVGTCRDWDSALRAAIERSESDWEWESVLHVRPNTVDDAMAASLAVVGIPVQRHAKIAEEEARRWWGGAYDAIWLRWAHRDRAHLLRIAIELDGQYLHIVGGEGRDQKRDQILADRSWYVARLSGSIAQHEIHRLAQERLTALVKQHRRAIVVARSDVPALMRNLA
jgi:hypothetical protein